MKLHIKAISAVDVPKMDIIGKCDPYLTIKYNKSSEIYKTCICKQTFSPIWNDEFHIPVEKDGTIHIEFYDFDKVSKDDLISTRDFSIQQFKLGKVVDDWYDFFVAPKVSKPGRIHLVFHLANDGDRPFVPSNPEVQSKNIYYKLKPKTLSQEQYEEFKQAFNEIDVDHSGSINFEETKIFLEKIGVNHVFAPLAFEICNKNPSSSITFEEFGPLYKVLEDLNKDRSCVYRILFEKLDEDKSGYLDKDELLKLLCFFGGDDWDEDDAERFLTNHDTNKDGKLDFDEVCHMIDDELPDN